MNSSFEQLSRSTMALKRGTLRSTNCWGESFSLPAVDPRALHALGDRLTGTDPAPLAAFVDSVNAWLSARLDGGRQDRGRMARLAEVWDKVNAAARDVETFNLERKPLVFNVFGWLAEASRG